MISRISSRAEIYAEALFSSLSPKNPESLEQTLQQLQELSAALAGASSGRERDFLLSPVLSAQVKKQAFLGVSLSSALVKNFLFVLIDNDAVHLLPQITEAFRNLLNNRLDAEEGEIVSAAPVSIEEKSRLEEALKVFCNKKSLRLQQKTDPSLIGGVFIRTRDFLVNDALSFHLKQFETKSN